METTFITIHDISPDARILYASNSIADILGYKPNEVVGRSCWEYFHPDEIPFAQAIHERGVQLDRAAVLNYCQIKNSDGLWVGCECVFTVTYDVMVGCTSIYRRGPRSQNRAADAPIIRQLFSSSPKDPRYHMLSYISSKFSSGPKPHIHEPRAAIFVNRFTRTLTIMYATNGLEKLLGISGDELLGKSFYYCIQEACLPEAVRCLESAKANDSIAYLRFWYRDPRQDDPAPEPEPAMPEVLASDVDDEMDIDDEDEDGGVPIASPMDTDNDEAMLSVSSVDTPARRASRPHGPHPGAGVPPSSATATPRDSSSKSKTPDSVFDPPAARGAGSTGSSSRSSDSVSRQLPRNAPRKPFPPPATANSAKARAPTTAAAAAANRRPIELEAVVSCTSDGLVVILRGARPFVLDSLRPAPPRQPVARPAAAANPTPAAGPMEGVFAAPWSLDPPPGRAPPAAAGPPPQQPAVPAAYASPAGAAGALGTGPSDLHARSFMDTIRDVAVFAWALTGINGSLAQYSRGKPRPGAQPYGGLPVWDQDVRS